MSDVSRGKWIERGTLALAAMSLVAAIGLAARTAWDAATLPASATAPRALRADPDAFCDGDRALSLLVVGSHVWMPCSARSGAGTAHLERIDVESGTLESRWRFGDLPPFEMLGAMVGPDGAVALAYRIAVPENRATRGGGIAVAIAGPSGWRRRPIEIERASGAQLLGMAFTADVLEVALRGPGPADGSLTGPVRIVTVPIDGALRTDDVPLAAMCRDITSTCWVEHAFRPRGAGSFRFVLHGVVAGERTWLWTASADGTREPIGLVETDRARFDMSAAGVFREWPPHAIGRVLEPDGGFRPPVRGSARVTELQGVYEWADGGMRLRRRYRADPRTVDHVVGDRVVRTQFQDGHPPVLAVGSEIVARVARSEDASLTHGTVVSRRDGGLALVSSEGLYLTLDRDGRRADPLDVLTHVEATSSPRSARLWWMLHGLPILLVIGTIAALIVRRRRGSPVVRAIAIGVLAASLVFLASSTWALDGLSDALAR